MCDKLRAAVRTCRYSWNVERAAQSGLGMRSRSEYSIEAVIRRLLLWTAVCSISAGPSFYWAMGEFNVPAMITGVALFIVIMTAMTCSRRFLTFRKRPFVKSTLYVGYGTRVVLSIVFPVGMAADLLPGLISIAIVQWLGVDSHGFAGTLIATMVQGTFLNLIISLLMLMVYAAQLATGTPPPPRTELVCLACKYDLRGSLESETCPECGEEISKRTAMFR